MSPTLSDADRERLIQEAITGKEFSYSPYSKFRVGAAFLCADGQLFKGANVENATYGPTICAERTAIVKAITEGNRKFVGLAVTSDVAAPISPCGMCRQVIREFCPLDMPILLVPSDYPQTGKDVKNGGVVDTNLDELFPRSFGPEQLEMPRTGGH